MNLMSQLSGLELTGQIMRDLGVNVPLVSVQKIQERLFPELRKEHDPLTAFKSSLLHQYNQLSPLVQLGMATPDQQTQYEKLEANLMKAAGGLAPSELLTRSRTVVNDRIVPVLEGLLTKLTTKSLAKSEQALLDKLWVLYLQNQKGQMSYPPRSAAGAVTGLQYLRTQSQIGTKLARAGQILLKSIDPTKIEASYIARPAFQNLANMLNIQAGGAHGAGARPRQELQNIFKNPHDYYLYMKGAGEIPRGPEALAYYKEGEAAWDRYLAQMRGYGEQAAGIEVRSSINLGRLYGVPPQEVMRQFGALVGGLTPGPLEGSVNAIKNQISTEFGIQPITGSSVATEKPGLPSVPSLGEITPGKAAKGRLLVPSMQPGLAPGTPETPESSQEREEEELEDLLGEGIQSMGLPEGY
jgi:hypothetical protein